MQNAGTTWTAGRTIEPQPKLTVNRETDVVIIGAGLTGLLSAYTLAKAGKKVIVLEKNRIANGTTMATTAFLTQIIDTAAEDVVRMIGMKQAKLMYTSHMAAISLIERIVRDEKIVCDFRRVSNYIIATTKDEAEYLEDELDILRAIGINALLHLRADIGLPHTAAIEIKDQAAFQPIAFISGLVRVLLSLGVEMYEETEVLSLTNQTDPSTHGDYVVAATADHAIRAKWSVTATYQPFDNPASVFMKKGMYLSYVYEIEVPKGRYKAALYEDMKNPYHYIRIDEGGEGINVDTVIVGGEDHRKDLPIDHDTCWASLTDYIEQMFGKASVGDYRVVRRWTGPILEPSDGFALIGFARKQQIVATGFSGNGITYAGITALVVQDLVEKGISDWAPLYDPKRRLTFKAMRIKGRDYATEMIHGAFRTMLVYTKNARGQVVRRLHKMKQNKTAQK